MSGRSNRSSAASLVAPGLGQDPIVGAIQAAGRAIQDVSDRQHQLVAGTVTASPSQLADAVVIGVRLDGADAPILGHTMNGWAPPAGARVMVLLYPPRGVLILGEISDSRLITQTGPSITLPGSVFASLQTFSNNSPAGIIYLNDDGGSVVATPMRAHSSEGGNIAQTTTSASYVNIGTAATDLTMPYPASGVVVVTISGALTSSSALAADFALGSFEIRDNNSSGTIRYTANDNQSLFVTGAALAPSAPTQRVASRVVVATGLPNSGTMFMRPMFRATAGTCTWSHPAIAAVPSL